MMITNSRALTAWIDETISDVRSDNKSAERQGALTDSSEHSYALCTNRHAITLQGESEMKSKGTGIFDEHVNDGLLCQCLQK